MENKEMQEIIEISKAEGKELPVEDADNMFAELNAEGELEDINDAGSGYPTSSSNKDNGGLVECFCQKKTGT